MKDLSQFVSDRLTALHDRPCMWAGTKEAFVLQVILLVEIVSDDSFTSSRLLTKFFPGTNVVPSEPFDEVWAHNIVCIARQELPRAAMIQPMTNARTTEQESARQQLIDAVKTWRETTCLYAKAYPPGQLDDSLCDGDNHLEECPVERARQDILAAHNKVEQLRAG